MYSKIVRTVNLGDVAVCADVPRSGGLPPLRPAPGAPDRAAGAGGAPQPLRHPPGQAQARHAARHTGRARRHGAPAAAVRGGARRARHRGARPHPQARSGPARAGPHQAEATPAAAALRPRARQADEADDGPAEGGQQVQAVRLQGRQRGLGEYTQADHDDVCSEFLIV